MCLIEEEEALTLGGIRKIASKPSTRFLISMENPRVSLSLVLELSFASLIAPTPPKLGHSKVKGTRLVKPL